MHGQTLPSFELAAALRAECHVLGRLPFSHVLLMNKSEMPWFILVPETAVIECCDLNVHEQQTLQDEINRLSHFIRARFPITKLNVATIGNIVAQLHIHIIGRHPADAWWPNVAWGQRSAGGYEAARVSEIANLLVTHLGSDYRPA